jgi:hypothetical protein
MPEPLTARILERLAVDRRSDGRSADLCFELWTGWRSSRGWLGSSDEYAGLPLLARERSSDSCHGSTRPRSRTVSTDPPSETTREPAELADGLALARYAEMLRRFAPAIKPIAVGPPLTGHGWSGDSARYVARHAITVLDRTAARGAGP